MRLDRYISEATGISRKEATKALHREEVTVDGVVHKKGAFQVPEGAKVVLNHIPLKVLGPTYLMMHKPLDCVCANDDPVHMTVFSYLDVANPAKLHTVGRLDLDTSGLLLITNDGQWSHRITSPKRECSKVYRAWLADPLTPADVEAFAAGLQLRGEAKLTAPATLEIVSEREALVTVHEGRYHQVRRMFAAVGNKVEQLHREQVGELVLDPELGPGETRELTPEEIALF
ncbi:16S rRNA pseudouridine(516) synthase [Aliidiomarina taiwanensis]|uniref:Pseudouridine synthase n=1 Tax=Aliidiomarina taiwanensis TaxID=946228 RepID=A0A432WZZ1_9GAMM|nr:pseudouridine synthase [Aliidiomarina taiwanensis]RUO39365.1 16S rRNA pseudouridine(516) synthase [Aliidiomarina taiwanensis]